MQPDEPCESSTCASCGRTFKKARSDEEAVAEARSLWTPETMADEQAVICDPCFREFMAWAEVNAPETLREPPADPIGDVLRADAQAAREEIRAEGLICPSCGQNWADLIGRHSLVMIIADDTPWCECRDGAQVLLGPGLASRIGPAKAWEKMQAAASISVADEAWRLETIAFARDIIGTGPAEFTGLLSILEQP